MGKNLVSRGDVTSLVCETHAKRSPASTQSAYVIPRGYMGAVRDESAIPKDMDCPREYSAETLGHCSVYVFVCSAISRKIPRVLSLPRASASLHGRTCGKFTVIELPSDIEAQMRTWRA